MPTTGFNERVYSQMSFGPRDADPEYIITRTRLRSPMYGGAIDPVISALGIPVEDRSASGNEGLVVLRSTVMNPFLAAGPPAPDHLTGLVAAPGRAAENALRA